MKKFLGWTVLLVSLVGSCSLPLDQTPRGTADPGATGSLSVTMAVPAALARSLVAPGSGSRGLTVSAVTVTLSKTGATDVVVNLVYNSATNTATGTAANLAQGSWTVVGVAKDSGGNTLYSGQGVAAIKAGANTITLDLIQDSGAAKVTLDWGVASPFTTLVVTASRATFPSVVKTVYLTGTETGSATYLMNLTKGDWTLAADVYLNSVKYFTYAGAVTVATGAIAETAGTMTAVKTTPVQADPPAGSYLGPYTVTLKSPTPGAVVRYTTNGSVPTPTTGSLFNAASPPPLSANTTLKAISYVPGQTALADGDPMVFDFKVKASAPTPDVAPGASTNPFKVKLSTLTAGATIRFTLDGTTPSATNGCVYSDTVPIWVSQANTTVRAVTLNPGNDPSEVAVLNYTVAQPSLVEVVPIAGGTFSNGTSNVTVSSFYMGKFEVTQAQYKTVMGVSTLPASPAGVGDAFPVSVLDWYEAVAVCNSLSIQAGFQPVYSINPTVGSDASNTAPTSYDTKRYLVISDFNKNGYRLPTEAEWEYACRAGTTSDYYWGSVFDASFAWYSGNSSSTTHAVGTKRGNPLGLYDMAGNLWQWCWDWYGAYPTSAQTNPKGPPTGGAHVLRGGSWNVDSPSLCSNYRFFDYPYNVNVSNYVQPNRYYYGFRVVRNP